MTSLDTADSNLLYSQVAAVDLGKIKTSVKSMEQKVDQFNVAENSLPSFYLICTVFNR